MDSYPAIRTYGTTSFGSAGVNIGSPNGFLAGVAAGQSSLNEHYEMVVIPGRLVDLFDQIIYAHT